METYKEILDRLKAEQPDTNFRELQKLASTYHKLQKAAAEKAKEKPEEVVAERAPEAEPVVDTLDGVNVRRSAIIEQEIRSKPVTLKRIDHILDGFGFTNHAVRDGKKKGEVYATAPGIRVPVKGYFNLAE